MRAAQQANARESAVATPAEAPAVRGKSLDPALSSHAREDPYWETEWPDKTSVAWVEREQTDRLARRGGRFPRGGYRSQDESVEAAFRRPLVLATILGAVESFRTLTQSQLASIVGDTKLLGDSPQVLRAAWSAGLLDAYPLDDMSRLEPWGPQAIWRPAARARVHDEIKKRFTTAEYVAATGGAGWTQAGSRPRHDVLATEFALRAAEHCPSVHAVLGEVFSSAALLLRPPGLDYTDAAQWSHVRSVGKKHADITLVRDDGLRIAVEIVANVNKQLPYKVDFWVERLNYSSAPLDTGAHANGLVVLFVTAPHPRVTSGAATTMFDDVRYAIGKSLASNAPGNAAKRISVVDWRTLFPAPHEIAPGFRTLSTQGLPKCGTSTWESRELLNPSSVPFNPDSPETMRAVIAAAGALGQTPSVLRRLDTLPDFARALMAGASLSKVPTPHPIRPDQASATPRPLGEGQGAAARTRPPRRVLGFGGDGQRR